METSTMSLRTLSNLAVQDITDESAEIHGGGVSFIGTDLDSGFGSGPQQIFPVDGGAFVGQVREIKFINNNPLGPNLAPFDNTLDRFQVTGAGTRKYRVEFFDNNNLTGPLGDFTLFGSGANTNTVNLSSFARIRVSSVRITRSA
jgi:hypothetical protein